MFQKRILSYFTDFIADILASCVYTGIGFIAMIFLRVCGHGFSSFSTFSGQMSTDQKSY